jgi:flagellar hook-length control protein FliK
LEANIRAQNRITTANGKPEAVPVSNAFGSQKTPPLVDKGLPPQVLVDNDSELTGVSKQPAIAGKSVVPDSQKVPEQNPNLPLVQDKPSGLQPKAVGIGLRKFPLTAEEGVDNRTNPAQQGQILPDALTDDKATAVQPRRPGTPQLTELLADDGIKQGDNFPGKPASQELRHPQLQVSTGQIKGRGSSASNNNSDSGFEQILSGNNAAAYIEEQSSAIPNTVTTDNLPAQTSSSDVSASITEQILESINSPSSQQAGTQQITVRLNPPELGKVFIKFEEQDNQITGLLEISKVQTRYEVERALPQIIQNLADSGIQVRRLEVMLTNQNEQQSYRDELLQDSSFQQYHDLPERGNPDNHDTVATNESDIFGHDGSYWGNLEPQMQITDNSINILI